MADLPKFSGGRWVRKLTDRSVPTEYRKQWRISPMQLKKKYPDLVTALDERGSKAAAHQWWHDLMAEVRAKTVVPEPTLLELVKKTEKRIRLSKQEQATYNKHVTEAAEKARKALSAVHWSDEKPTPLQVDLMESALVAAFNDQLPLAPVITEDKFSFWRDKWIAFKASELKPSSMLNVPHHLMYLQQLVGEHENVATITEELLERLKVALNTKKRAGDISSTYADNICRTIKPFVKYLAKHRKIIMPNNLDDLQFKKITPVPKPISLNDARTMIEKAGGALKTWLLLMFQSAYTQKDISDLKASEIKGDRVERKRSKEEDEQDVPIVNYLMWPEVAAGVREHGSRSGLVFTHNSKPPIVGRSDKIAREFAKLMDELGMAYTPKQIRKTVANLLYEVKAYGPYVYFYCGWSPASVQDKSYLVPPLPIQDEMTMYLRLKLLND